MYVKNLSLNSFRSYNSLYIDFLPGVNVFLGNNGTGKTNVLEALYCLSAGRSFRTSEDALLVKHNLKAYKIHAEVSDNGLDKEYSIEYNAETKRKSIKENNTKLSKMAELIGRIPVVLFSPENIMTIKAEPQLRRKFIDEYIYQINKEHYITSTKYAKEVAHRNYLLKLIREKKSTQDNLSIWNEQLAENGSRIIVERLKAVKELNRILEEKLSDNMPEIKLNYISKKECVSDGSQMKKILLDSLNQNIDEEIARATTLFGPHRDDIEILFNGVSAKNFASEGQQRIAAIMMKLGEGLAIVEKRGSYPIVLLDDFSSELDDINRGIVGKTFLKFKQIIITTAGRDKLKGFDAVREFKVTENGIIS
ncbi:MAG TPA: DNA replication and repair protein RecF [Candidatus Goldiibacteriota bacterium]|nr:DNA replication and repair protein RecF [Candidatus Goldiibacteriota bacterium]